MNKKVIVIIVALVLLLGGGYMFMKSKTVTTSTNNNTNMMADSGDSGIFTSVKDALSKKMTLVCEFSDDKGTYTKSYIKNGAVRVSGTSSTEANQSGEFIMKDNKMYMWDSKTKVGFVYTVPESEAQANVNQGDSYLNMIDTYKDSCKVAAVEDSYFVLPTDVNFQDMSKFLEDSMKQIPQTPQGY